MGVFHGKRAVAGAAWLALLSAVVSGARADDAPPKATPIEVGGPRDATAVTKSTPRHIEPAHPEAAPPVDGNDYTTHRYEPAGFPLIGGDSDIGLEVGAVGTITRFADGRRPYVWNMDLVLAASVKSGPSGAEIAQQHYLWNLDIPSLGDAGVRLNPAAAYTRTINAGYFGLGNASSRAVPADVAGTPGRYHQYVSSEAFVRNLTRIALGQSPLSFVSKVEVRAIDSTVYAGSKLAQDAAATGPNGGPLILGVAPSSQIDLSVGLMYDTRDNEIFTRSGQYHAVALKVAQGLPYDRDIRYGGGSATVAFYAPLGGPFVVAWRGVADLLAGNVPFFDLYTGGTFLRTEMPGGSDGIRGVPVGRYLGKIKAISNLELRAMLVKLNVLGQKLELGNDVFVDVGRVWSDYTFHAAIDGTGLGLKYGVGGGLYVLWGQAALFRIEAAYSPDAVAENPNFPIGLYVEDGVLF